MTDQEETMECESAENNGLPDQFQTSAVGPPQGPYTPPDTHQPMGQDGMVSSTASNRGVTAAREVDSVSTFTGLQKHTADQDEKTTQASKDVTDIHVQIDWTDKEPPLKWEKYLCITVQTLFNTTPKYRSYAIQNLRTLDSSAAHITVSPPEAQQALLELKSTKLNFKGLGELTVYFKEALLASHSPALVDTPQQKYSQRKVEEARLLQEVPMAVSAKVDLHKYDAKQQKELLIRFPKYRTGSHTLQIDGTYEEVGQFHKELNEALRKPVTATSDHTAPMETSASPLRVPVFQDWHLINLQSKEIERIQENNGVKIKTDVCVSFEEAGATNTQNLYLSDDNPDLPAVLPSAPPDLGSFYIRLHWPEVGLPQRWAPMLQKALQTWMNITLLNEINVRCNIHRLQPLETPGCAEVQLTPFAALSKILTKKSSHLTFKDLKQTAVVDFYSSAAQMNKSTDTMKNGQTALQIPIKVNAVVDVQNFSPQVQTEVMKRFKTYSSGPHNLCIQGALEDVNMFYDKLQQVVLQKEQLENSVSHAQPPTTTQNSESPKDLTLKVPLFQYTAACKAHGNKIRQILEENRVAMQAEVALSFKHQGTGVDMSSKACQEISKLLQSMGPPALNQTDSTTVERKQQPQSTGFGLPQEHSLGSKESPMMKESVASCNRPTEETAATAKAVCGVEAAHEEHVNNNNNQMLVHHVGKSNLKKASQQNQLSGIETTAPLVQTGRHCPICLKGVKNNLCLPCGDNFCGKCIEKALIKGQSRSCPLCQEDIEKIVGDQPKGKMTVDIERESLPGFLVYNTIRIDYDMPGAVQTKDHPRPGKQFRGLRATAYLPDSPDGQNVVQLLKRAFTQRLVFTVGASSATGEENCVLWNIPHKTSKYGGPSSSGYPDPDYIKKVKEELKAKGIE